MEPRRDSVLIVDDDKELCRMLALLLQREKFEVSVAHDGQAALDLLETASPGVLLVDVKMPKMDGITLLKKLQQRDTGPPVIMLTAYTGVADAVEVMRTGAFDYLSKPFDHGQVIRTVRSALQRRDIVLSQPDTAEAPGGRAAKRPDGKPQPLSDLRERMGPSSAIEKLIGEILCVAKTNFTVVIEGETGSGKSLLARAIHGASTRAEAPFIALDCGAIPENLLESELFGHEKGAFTGAERRKPGKFESAKGGTLFLDEISNMPLASQIKLLCALQDKTIYPVGSTKAIEVDVRLLAAANCDLRAAVVSGAFREDLFYRLNEYSLYVPPLRERSDDILFLAERFREDSNRELNKCVRRFSDTARNLLLAYAWPGNVRELRAAVRRAVLLADELVFQEHLEIDSTVHNRGRHPAWTQPEPMPFEGLSLREIVRRGTESIERKALAEALQYTRGNKAQAARLLRVDYKTIHTKLKKYGIMNGE